MTDSAGKLYLVPTPIGNLEDMTERGLKVLREVDLIACEDTRHSGRLLKTFGIEKPLTSYHEFNERARAEQIASRIHEGESVAVITDAGSPGISDPAYRVVRAALDLNIDVSALPGPSALLPALTASGLPTDRFLFEGFLPPKGAARKKRLEQLAEFAHTIVFYESPHRTLKTLTDMREVLGDRPACLAREISKQFEEFIRGRLDEIIARIEGRRIRGEIVLVVAGKSYVDKLLRQEKDYG